VLGGFKARAQEVFDLLRAERVAFVLVTSPDPLAIDEAMFFFDRLAGSQMPMGAFVINRVHPTLGPPPAADEVVTKLALRPELQSLSPEELARASRALRENAEQFEMLARVDAAQIARLQKKCGDAHPYVLVPFLDSDVYDTSGLVAIEERLFTAAPSPASNS
jgi:anion-transporting  ArsA/GET3 family ATPase